MPLPRNNAEGAFADRNVVLTSSSPDAAAVASDSKEAPATGNVGLLIIALAAATLVHGSQCTARAQIADSANPKSFSIRVDGHGRPMILIPGLTCGGDVWKTTVEHFKNRYECHMLTLPGFAGQPPSARPCWKPSAKTSRRTFVKSNLLVP